MINGSSRISGSVTSSSSLSRARIWATTWGGVGFSTWVIIKSTLQCGLQTVELVPHLREESLELHAAFAEAAATLIKVRVGKKGRNIENSKTEPRSRRRERMQEQR